MPKTLFVRALLIVLLPTVLAQFVAAYIFYNRHWDNVTRHMGNTLAGEIAFFTYQFARAKGDERESIEWIFEDTTGISATFRPGKKLAERHKDEDYPDFQNILADRIDMPFSVERLDDENRLQIAVELADGVLVFHSTVKRLESGTTTIFILWMVGSSFVLLLIAIVFLRNQVRPIRQLAEAADSFGKGRDISDFKPHGALEVRRAARAFLVMRERIQRQIRSRTEMLAGISHDLRTPLTRMKLQLAMMGEAPEIRDLSYDVTQMEHMITEYLDFARGEGGEDAVQVSLTAALAGIRESFRRLGQEVEIDLPSDLTLEIRPQAFHRMMANLAGNALRYGKTCRISAKPGASKLELFIDDTGPGIPPEKREEVFKPFTRLDSARNLNTPGVGLGLAIARDVARSHGGNITLADAPGGGLRVVVRLPL